MIDRGHPLSLTRQSEILQLSRSSLYYEAVPISARDLELMRLIDEIHLKYPFMGSRSIRDQLQGMGHDIGRGHVRTLMKKMGIEAIYKRPPPLKTSSGTQDLPISSAGIGSKQRQPGVGSRHHLSADGTRLLLPCGNYGLGKQEGIIVEAFKYA